MTSYLQFLNSVEEYSIIGDQSIEKFSWIILYFE